MPAPVNNVNNLTMIGTSVWQYGLEFTRTDLGIPQHIKEAYRSGTVAELNISDTDRWLLKNTKGKATHNIKFPRRSRQWAFPADRKFDKFQKAPSSDKNNLVTFHAERMREVWDFAGFEDGELEKLLGSMLNYTSDLTESKHIPEKSFEVRSHWFTRDDAEEFRNCGSLERLLSHLGGSIPKNKKVESQDRKANNRKEKQEVAKRKAASDTFQKNAKKIKTEEKGEVGSDIDEEEQLPPAPKTASLEEEGSEDEDQSESE